MTTEIDEATLQDAVSAWTSTDVRILAPGPETRALIPAAWWPVAESSDPEERKQAARALWNEDFLALIPRYAEALRTALVDVRVARHDVLFSRPTLDYVLRDDEDELFVWAAEDPRLFGDSEEPPLFEAVPEPVARFLREVHAGYTAYDGEAAGLASPVSRMNTLAAQWYRCRPSRNSPGVSVTLFRHRWASV